MSEVLAPRPRAALPQSSACSAPGPTSGLAGAVLLLALPFYLDRFWLQAGLFAMAAAIGAIGLNLLTGATGQLSMGHAFFLAVGAYGYCVFAGGRRRTARPGRARPAHLARGRRSRSLVAGVAGGLFSPIAGRLRGAYLGIATLALIFIGQHVLFNAAALTGGFNGRAVPPLASSGSPSTTPNSSSPPCRSGPRRSSGTLGLAAPGLRGLFARGVLRGRPGRAMNAIRDHRDRRRGDGRARRPLPRRRVRPVVDVRGPGGRPARPGLPADRARVLRHDRCPSSTSP